MPASCDFERYARSCGIRTISSNQSALRRCATAIRDRCQDGVSACRIGPPARVTPGRVRVYGRFHRHGQEPTRYYSTPLPHRTRRDHAKPCKFFRLPYWPASGSKAGDQPITPRGECAIVSAAAFPTLSDGHSDDAHFVLPEGPHDVDDLRSQRIVRPPQL